jgi:hypothetical protein
MVDRYLFLNLVGINSFYKENIKSLKEVISEFDTLMPYAVTELFPKGYIRACNLKIIGMLPCLLDYRMLGKFLDQVAMYRLNRSQ